MMLYTSADAGEMFKWTEHRFPIPPAPHQNE